MNQFFHVSLHKRPGYVNFYDLSTPQYINCTGRHQGLYWHCSRASLLSIYLAVLTMSVGATLAFFFPSLLIFRNIKYLRGAILLPQDSLASSTGMGNFQSCSCFVSLWTSLEPTSPNILSPLFMDICSIWSKINPSVHLFGLWSTR